MVTLTRHINAPRSYDLELPGRGTLQDKFYVGFIKVADDVLRMGRLKVWIPELNGDPNDENGWFIVSYCSPFAGATSIYDNKNENTFAGTQKSYGMWFIPPDVNNEVVCAFINGDPARGIWLGCLYQQNMNHMVPGLPGQDSTASTPVAEYNKKVVNTNLNNPVRPEYSPLAEGLLRQGLNVDTIRGVSDSGARRAEPANSIYGILTPGGSQMVFDDSPTNNYIRFRTQSGAQIMINDTSGFIYLNSVDGKNWISMDATGKVDIYAQDDITLRSQGSINIRGDLDVNIEAGRDINMRARGKPTTAGVSSTAGVPPPSLPATGNIVVVGDSIAQGVGSRIEGAVVSAVVGESSTEIAVRVRENTSIQNSVNAILSVGSNDGPQGNQSTLTSNLDSIRTSLASNNYIWLLPYDDVLKATVKTFADSKGDKTLNLSRYPSSDNLHPRDYALVANDARALCIPSPDAVVNGVTGASAGGVGQTPYGPYNTGTFRSLEDAEAKAAQYRSAVEFGRANPSLYTPAEMRAMLYLESAANTEVQRLRGQNATTPATIQSQQTGPTGPVAPGAAASPTSATGASENLNYISIASQFIKQEEGRGQPSLRAYRDPPRQSINYAIAFGHNMGMNELSSRSRQRAYIDAGFAGQVPIVGTYGENTTCNAEQAEGIFQVDLRKYEQTAQNVLRGTYDQLGPYQKASMISFCYNAGGGGLGRLRDAGLSNFVNQRDIESAAALIEQTITRASDGTDLTRRRRNEANLFRNRPELAGIGAGGREVDGYTRGVNDTTRASAQDQPLSSPDTTVVGGYIKMQSRNSMHLLSEQHMFITSAKDMHRLAGNNLFDSAGQNINRAAGGFVHESARGAWTVGAAGQININGPRIDLNGAPPPPATAAALAEGPASRPQSDIVLNSLGNAVVVLTDTILPHLPHHEPYENHGGRNFQNLRDSTQINNNTGLRDGEIALNSNAPLDIYGSPRSDMPPAVYRGVAYNSRNQPLYRYEATLIGRANVMTSNSLVLSDEGRQFIVSRENGSYRPIEVGNPPKQEIGYGHTLTPEELSAQTIRIGSDNVQLNAPLTQQQINELFDQDIQVVQQWVRPEITQGVSQTQYDMFCSLAFNIGENNFKRSDALKNFNENNLSKVPNTWMQHTVNAVGQVLPGLVLRRRAEIINFISGPATDFRGGESQSDLIGSYTDGLRQVTGPTGVTIMSTAPLAVTGPTG
jgi:GH24 family phage-related lysozyme (muramidase)